MAKLTDKFYVRIIEGQLELDPSEQAKQDASAVKAVEGASAGTIDKPLGLSSQGKLVKGDFPSELPAVAGNAGKVLKVNSGATGVEWGSVSGGTQLYKHEISMANTGKYYAISLGNTPLTAHPITNTDEALKILYAYFTDGTRIIQFYADSNDNYKEKYCAIGLSGGALSSVPNYVTGILGTFVSDTVTPL